MILNLCCKDRGSFFVNSETMKLSSFHLLSERMTRVIFSLTKTDRTPGGQGAAVSVFSVLE